MESLNIHEHKKRLLITALNRAGKVNGAHALLGIPIKTVYNLMGEYGIEKKPVYSSKRTVYRYEIKQTQ